VELKSEKSIKEYLETLPDDTIIKYYLDVDKALLLDFPLEIDLEPRLAICPPFILLRYLFTCIASCLLR